MLWFSFINPHETGASFQPVASSKTEPQGSVQRGFSSSLVFVSGCSWLYQLVVTARGGGLLPHQWLLYFPTCQVNIWKWALALEADCRWHWCDYGHKNMRKASKWWGYTCRIWHGLKGKLYNVYGLFFYSLTWTCLDFSEMSNEQPHI